MDFDLKQEIARLERETQAKELANNISRFVNRFDIPTAELFAEISNDHRTLQQSFTGLCLKWLEHVASDDYRTDGRNEASQKVARRILRLWLADEDESFGIEPSRHLPTI